MIVVIFFVVVVFSRIGIVLFILKEAGVRGRPLMVIAEAVSKKWDIGAFLMAFPQNGALEDAFVE